jgi:ureidoacrylate peracid hydrolase
MYGGARLSRSNKPGREGDLAQLAIPSQTAVLVIDVQNDFVADDGRVGRSGVDMHPLQKATKAINRLITAARESAVTVFYVAVEHGHQVDLPPYQARYERRGMTPDDTICQAGTWGADLYEGLLPPEKGEPRLVKHGYDAFQGTDLESALLKSRVRTVIVTGVVTELCVRATVASAFERGFFPIIPRECTASTESEPADAAFQSMERWYGEVVSLDDLIRLWSGIKSASGATS